MSEDYPVVDGLDIGSAVQASSGSYEDYMYILKTYYRNIDNQAENIRNALDNNDITNYTIYVHALKSSSRSVGAYDLGDMAYELEMCGKSNDNNTIREKTPKLLAALDNLKINMSVLFDNESEADDIDIEDFIYMLESLKGYMEEDDLILVNDMLEQMEGLHCNRVPEQLMQDIETMALSMEYGQCIEMIDSFLATL